jgi:hypothetical protein
MPCLHGETYFCRLCGVLTRPSKGPVSPKSIDTRSLWQAHKEALIKAWAKSDPFYDGKDPIEGANGI